MAANSSRCVNYEFIFDRSIDCLRFLYVSLLQLQMFCLYKRILCYVWTDSSFDIFNLNRSHILEGMTYSWIWAMFTNSLLVNSPQAWQQHYEYIKQQTHY